MSTYRVPGVLQCTEKRPDENDSDSVSALTNLPANYRRGLIVKEQKLRRKIKGFNLVNSLLDMKEQKGFTEGLNKTEKNQYDVT